MSKRNQKKNQKEQSFALKRNIIIFLSLFIIVLVTIISFSSSLKNDFTNWDDNEYVTLNPHIMSFSGDNLKNIFSSLYVANYLPITMLTYMIEFYFFKLDPFIYHLTNLILHSLNSLLVFWFIMLLSKSVFISFITAMLFAIHPMHVESVAWVSERKDVLSTFFYLSSLVAYLYHKVWIEKNQNTVNIVSQNILESNNSKKKVSINRFYFLSVIFLILSLLSKPMAVSLPFVLILIDYLHGIKFQQKIFIEKIPFFVIAASFVLITLITQKGYGAIREYPFINIFHKFLIPCYGITFYLIKMIFPFHLSAIYPFPNNSGAFYTFKFLISPLFVFLIVLLNIYSLRFTKKIVFGFSFFLITILPVLQIIPIGHAIVADRYTYFPFIGIFYIIADGIFYLLMKINKNNFSSDINKIAARNDNFSFQLYNYIIVFILIFIFGLYSVLTYNRCKIWKDSFALYNDILSKYPNASLPHNNLANTYKDMGDYQKALYHYGEAIKSDPTYSMAYYNRGTVYNDLNEFDKAIEDLTKSIKMNPKLSQAYNNRGASYNSKGEYDKAIEDYNIALKLKPNNVEAINNRATAYARKGEYDIALKGYTDALKLNPNYAIIYMFRGEAYAEIGEYESAISDYSTALKLKEDLFAAYYKRALAYFAIKDFKKSLEDIAILQRAGKQVDEELLNKLKEATGSQTLQ